ncbi:hypothetical protein NE237_006490 [Protea cynaroides]|uniref:Helicase MAGATAMA 3 n=1 Tax=Protea cynaroides TaxID=273540 RepID=A0A9Q0KML0_9MAGN|nr:hypothetical protein NE237_006490 [Protea cynaroides]
MASGLVNLVFSWSLRDVLNDQLFKAEVKKIPKTFLSVEHYFTSFIFPLIEETHAGLYSNMMNLSHAPKCQIDYVKESEDHRPPQDLFYDMVVRKEGDSKHRKEIYKPQVGDLIALSDVKPVCIDDLNRPRRSFLLAIVTVADEDGGEDEVEDEVEEEEEASCFFKVLLSKPIMFVGEVQKKKEPLFAVYLMNMITNTRIWNALHPEMQRGNMNVIREVLSSDSTRGGNFFINLNENKREKQWQEKILAQLNCQKPEDPSETKKTEGQEDEKKRCIDNCARDLKFFVLTLCKHLPTSFLSVSVVQDMIRAIRLLDSLGTLLHESVCDEELKCVFVGSEDLKTTDCGSKTLLLYKTRNECLQILKCLLNTFSVPNFTDKLSIGNFCLQHAYLIFCTAASSAKLHTDGMPPLELLIIDEAAQLKECESAISLQLPAVRHAILIGDEQQLPAMVLSKISGDAEFGRSLFERLVSLGHKKHLLNIQYRMHPSISLFPNTEFYKEQILDAPNVKERSHERQFLHGSIYGPYSFINVAYGREENVGHGMKNMVEVAVVSEIVKLLFKASVASKQQLSVGVISPYKAQVFAIKEKLGDTYHTPNDFSVSVRTVDGFQGGEEDVIIISSVRCNGKGAVGFLANHQRMNVALTRARYCLWILGNGPTLINSGSIWRKLVLDAKDRDCFFDADKDESLKQAMIAGLIGLGEFDKLLNLDSLLFGEMRWKVFFSNNFWKSMAKIRIDTQKEAIALLMKLASGWRHPQLLNNLYLSGGTSSELLEVYKVDELLNIVWTVDIFRENFNCIQVLKVWDILPLQEIPKLANQLDALFGNYRVDDMNRCKFKCAEGDLEVPASWEFSSSGTFMNLQKPEPSLPSSFASLNLGKEANASTPLNFASLNLGKEQTTSTPVKRNKS